MLIAETLQEIEATDGRLAGEGAGHDKSLQFQKIQNCTHSAPGWPQPPVSNGICTLATVSKNGFPATALSATSEPVVARVVSYGLQVSSPCNVKSASRWTLCLRLCFLYVTGFWHLRQYCVNAHR